MPIEPTDLVDDVMTAWPATIRVFLDYKMLCVGCPISCFHTVADDAAALRRATSHTRRYYEGRRRSWNDARAGGQTDPRSCVRWKADFETIAVFARQIE